MERKTLLLVGGGALLLIVLYLAMRNKGGGASSYVVPASAPADPNVLAAQVAQDQTKGTLALAAINAAGTLDAIKASASADVARINAQTMGQGYLEEIAGNIQKSLLTTQYNGALSLAQVEHTNDVVSAPSQSSLPASTQDSRLSRLFYGSLAAGQTPTATSPLPQSTMPTQQAVQQQSQDCWWRRNVPLIGAFVC